MFAIEGMDEYSYFRGIQDMDGFVQEVEEYQQGPQFAEDLRTVGVECVVLGGVRDEVRFAFLFLFVSLLFRPGVSLRISS